VKAFIWKYALTKGIVEAEGELVAPSGKSPYYFCTKYFGMTVATRQYSLTREEAVQEAEEMRERKLKNIEKQVKKLKELKF
jgi:hypothetical protein